MTNWEACKYESLLTLQNDAAKNSLWRSTALNIPRNSSFITTQNNGADTNADATVHTFSRQYW
jgi:hypothetical protein